MAFRQKYDLRDEDILYDVSNILENVGDNLKREPKRTVVLRLMQERISDLSKSSEDKDLVFLNHFLRSFIERLWFNLMIDFPYEVGEEASRIRREILDSLVQGIGGVLEELAGYLRKRDYGNCYKAYRALTNAYDQKIEELEAAKR